MCSPHILPEDAPLGNTARIADAPPDGQPSAAVSGPLGATCTATATA
jgi:hypothetical protein